jgi:uncharacterized protein YjbI with pentapeptide repeats
LTDTKWRTKKSNPERDKLTRADLTGASLVNAKLIGANLLEVFIDSFYPLQAAGSNFYKADLTRASLDGRCSFNMANFSYAIL